MVRGHSPSRPDPSILEFQHIAIILSKINLFKVFLEILQILYHLLDCLLAVGTILSEESLLSPRPNLDRGRTNLCIHNNFDWVVFSSIRNHRGIGEYTLYALGGGVIFLLPTVSVASCISISCMSRVMIIRYVPRTLVGKGRRERKAKGDTL